MYLYMSIVKILMRDPPSPCYGHFFKKSFSFIFSCAWTFGPKPPTYKTTSAVLFYPVPNKPYGSCGC